MIEGDRYNNYIHLPYTQGGREDEKKRYKESKKD